MSYRPLPDLRQLRENINSLSKQVDLLMISPRPLPKLWDLVMSIRGTAERFDVWNAVNEKREGQVSYAPDLQECLDSLLASTIPAFVEKASHLLELLQTNAAARSCRSPSLVSILVGSMLNVMSIACTRYHCLTRLNARLIFAVIRFGQWLGPLDLEQSLLFVGLVRRMLEWVSQEDSRLETITPITFSMLVDTASRVCDMCRAAPCDLMCRWLIMIVLVRSTLYTMPRIRCAHVRRTLEASHAAFQRVGRLVIIALASRDAAIPLGDTVSDVTLRELFSTILVLETKPLPDAVMAPACSRYIRALYKLSARYPELAATKIVLRHLIMSPRSLMSADEVSIWTSTVAVCMRRIAQSMRERRPLTLLLPEAEAASMAVQAAVAADFCDEEISDHLGFARLSDLLSLRGSVMGLEALLRGTGTLLAVRQSNGSLLLTPFTIMQLILARKDPPTLPFPEMLSLAVTARKLLLYASDGILPIASSLEFKMADVMELLHPTVWPGDHDHHRMYLILAVCLQTVVRFMRAAGVPSEHNLPEVQQQVPDCDADPARWQGVTEEFGMSHDGARLLPGCGNLACPNLDRALDSLVQTKLCGGCRRVGYCCVECQRTDWGVRGCSHGRVCGRGWWLVQ